MPESIHFSAKEDLGDMSQSGFLIRVCVLIIAAICLFKSEVSSQSAQYTLAAEMDASTWIYKNFSKGKVPPFSFVSGGKESKTFITRWKYQAGGLRSNELDPQKIMVSGKELIKGFPFALNDKPGPLLISYKKTIVNLMINKY